MRVSVFIFMIFCKIVVSQNNKQDLFGFATSNTFTYCDLQDTNFLNKVIALNPKVLRFPGGAVGNYYHFGGIGYGFDFEEIKKYDAGKFLKRSRGLVRSTNKKGHTHDYIEDFILLAKQTNSKVILVANMFVDNDDIIKMIAMMINHNIEVIGVELGSELTNRYFFQKGYTIDDYLIAAKRCSKKIKSIYPNILTGIVAAPLGKKSGHRHNIWNTQLASLDFYDAIIVHSYPKVIKGVDQYGQMITEEKEGSSEEISFNIYKNRVLNFLEKDFPDEIKQYNHIFNKPIWITEWNLQMSKTTGNTMFQSLFVASYFLELLSNDDLDNILITTYHNLGGRDYSGSIFKGDNYLEIHSTYYPLKMIGELFNLTGTIQVERQELTRQTIKYLIYNNAELSNILFVNWSNNELTSNHLITKSKFQTYYSSNLYNKADSLGQLFSEKVKLLSENKIILKPYSLSLISFTDE